jgi:hypothetical protein
MSLRPNWNASRLRRTGIMPQQLRACLKLFATAAVEPCRAAESRLAGWRTPMPAREFCEYHERFGVDIDRFEQQVASYELSADPIVLRTVDGRIISEFRNSSLQDLFPGERPVTSCPAGSPSSWSGSCSGTHTRGPPGGTVISPRSRSGRPATVSASCTARFGGRRRAKSQAVQPGGGRAACLRGAEQGRAIVRPKNELGHPSAILSAAGVRRDADRGS